MNEHARLFILAAILAALLPAAPAAAEESGPAQKAMAIDDPHVTNYGVRARVSGRLFDAAKVEVNKMLGSWTEPQSTRDSNFYTEPGGFNTILDPGYDPVAKNAGGVRTTPVELMWAWRSDNCAGDDTGCLAMDQTTPRRFHWLQVRRPGDAGSPCNNDDRVNVNACGAHIAQGILCNQRGLPSYLQSFQREHGFFVADEGKCFNQQSACMWNRAGWCWADVCTHHQVNELGLRCDMDPLVEPPAGEIYMNAGVYIFPNGFVENAGGMRSTNLGADDPAWMRPLTLNYGAVGDYFGYQPLKRYGVYTGSFNNPHGYRTSGADGGGLTWKAGNFPADASDHDETRVYSELFGSYFRPGDDIAFYPDVREMQIHSIDRDALSTAAHGPKAVAGCGYGPVYTGTLDGAGEPIYFYDRVPQCLRPKSYWDSTKEKWIACKEWDSSDDARIIYPGNDATKTCGTTGWSALRVNTLALDPVNEEIDLNLVGDEWRLEMAIFFDFATECTIGVSFLSPSCGSRPGQQVKRKWATGAIMIDSVQLAGSAKILSYDNYSCGVAGGHCNDPWTGADDGLLRPDRFRIGLNLTTTAINTYAGVNRFRAVFQDLSAAGSTCYHSVYGMCVFRLGSGTAEGGLLVEQISGAVADVFQDEFAKLINDTVEEINTGLPNLNTMLGDPWNFGTSLVDVGLFLTGAGADGINDPLDATRKIWPVDIQPAIAGRSDIINLNGALGFRPIAFRPPNGNGIMIVDQPGVDEVPANADNGIEDDSFFAVPTMVYPDTGSCQVPLSGTGVTPVWQASGTGTATYTYTSGTGVLTGPGINATYNGSFFFDLSTWRWSKIHNVSRISTAHYLIDSGRAGDFNAGNWGISAGWLTLPASFSQGTMTDIRVGDQFTFAANPNNVYYIKAVNAGARQIQLDFDTGLAYRTYATTLNGSQAWSIVSRRCSRDNPLLDVEDEDQQYDYEDHMLEGNWIDPKTNLSYSGRRVIEPYWVAPYKRSPDWCMTPQRAKEEADALAARFPMSTWLAFDPSDTKPAGASSMVQPPAGQRDTVGYWDYIAGTAVGGRSIVAAHQNDYGVKESGNIDYDASIHIHQRAINQLLQAVVSSGAACIEFAPTDEETGEETPWASFLNTDAFAAFLPELQTQFPHAPVKVRIAPQSSPRARMGIGTLTHTHAPGIQGSAPITNEPYTMGIALPDLQLNVAVVDPESNVEIEVLKMNWNAVVGIYLRAMRQCHELDPLHDRPECTSIDPLVRTVSGYWQAYLDYGNDALASQFEPPVNIIDGFAAGRFTNHDFVTNNPGAAKFEVLEANCGEGCDLLGVAQAVVTLLDATVKLYMDTRASTEFFTPPQPTGTGTGTPARFFDVDFLYIGPDGPNDDGIGVSTQGSRGDYLGVYVRRFGQLDLPTLMAALGAPPAVTPKAVVPAMEGVRWIAERSPRFTAVAAAPGGDVDALFTWRLDGGFWRTPRNSGDIALESLTEGEHALEVRALTDTVGGFAGQVAPTRIEFSVDTLAPRIAIAPSPQGVYTRSVPVERSDLQTPSGELVTEYAFDGGPWTRLEAETVPLRGVAAGRHTLRVRATDLAGNTASVARDIVVGEGAGCGGCAGSSEAPLGLLLATLVWAALRRRRL